MGSDPSKQKLICFNPMGCSKVSDFNGLVPPCLPHCTVISPNCCWLIFWQHSVMSSASALDPANYSLKNRTACHDLVTKLSFEFHVFTKPLIYFSDFESFDESLSSLFNYFGSSFLPNARSSCRNTRAYLMFLRDNNVRL